MRKMERSEEWGKRACVRKMKNGWEWEGEKLRLTQGQMQSLKTEQLIQMICPPISFHECHLKRSGRTAYSNKRHVISRHSNLAKKKKKKGKFQLCCSSKCYFSCDSLCWRPFSVWHENELTLSNLLNYNRLHLIISSCLCTGMHVHLCGQLDISLLNILCHWELSVRFIPFRQS